MVATWLEKTRNGCGGLLGLVLALATAGPVTAAGIPDRPGIRDFPQVPACNGVADDSSAVAAIAAALRGTGRVVRVPPDCRLRLGGAAQVWLSGMGFAGDGLRTAGGGGGFVLTDRERSPFVVSSRWSLRGLSFAWPSQTEAAAQANNGLPTPFPPLLAAHGADQATFWAFDDNQVENAFDLIDLTGAATAGHFHLDRNLLFALRVYLRMRSSGGEGFITDNQFSYAASTAGITDTPAATTHLRDFAAANAEMLRIEGNGTARRVAGTAVEGLRLSGNYVFGLRYGVHAAGGTLNLGTLTANSFDQVETPVAADAGGALVATTVEGGTWLCQRLGGPPGDVPCMAVDGGAPGSSLGIANVQIPVSSGPGVVFHDLAANASFSMVGGSLLNVGQRASGRSCDGIDVDVPNGVLVLSGLPIISAAATPACRGTGVSVAARTSVLNGLTLGGWAVPVAIRSEAGRHSVTNSVSFDSKADPADPAIRIAGGGLVAEAGNAWDIGPNVLSVQGNGQGAGLLCGHDAHCQVRATDGALALSAAAGHHVVIPPSSAGGLAQCSDAPAGQICVDGSAPNSLVRAK